MADDNKKLLYESLSEEYDMGPYDEFVKDLEDEGKRRKLYDATSEDYDLGTWEDFSKQLGYGMGQELTWGEGLKRAVDTYAPGLQSTVDQFWTPIKSALDNNVLKNVDPNDESTYPFPPTGGEGEMQGDSGESRGRAETSATPTGDAAPEEKPFVIPWSDREGHLIVNYNGEDMYVPMSVINSVGGRKRWEYAYKNGGNLLYKVQTRYGSKEEQDADDNYESFYVSPDVVDDITGSEGKYSIAGTREPDMNKLMADPYDQNFKVNINGEDMNLSYADLMMYASFSDYGEQNKDLDIRVYMKDSNGKTWRVRIDKVGDQLTKGMKLVQETIPYDPSQNKGIGWTPYDYKDVMYLEGELDGEPYFISEREINEFGGWKGYAAAHPNLDLKIKMIDPDGHMQPVKMEEVGDMRRKGWKTYGTKGKETANLVAYDTIAGLWKEREAAFKEDQKRNAERNWGDFQGGRENRIMNTSLNVRDNMASHFTEFDLKNLMETAWERNKGRLIQDCFYYIRQEYPKASDREVKRKAEAMARKINDSQVYQYAVAKSVPKSALEYFARRVYDGNTLISITKACARAKAGGKTGVMPASDQAMAEYGQKHPVMNVVGTVGELTLDTGTPLYMAGGGMLGKTLFKGATMAAGWLLKTGEKVLPRLINGTLWGKGLMAAFEGVGSFATFDAAKDLEAQAALGGNWNPETLRVDEGISLEQTGEKALHGAGTGFLLGPTGALIGHYGDALVRNAASTAEKAMLTADKVLLQIGAETLIFAREDLANGEPLGKALSNAAGMSIGFKAKHGAKKAKSLWTGMRPVKEPKTAADYRKNRMSVSERIGAWLDGPEETHLTRDNIDELRRAGYRDIVGLYRKEERRKKKGERIETPESIEEGRAREERRKEKEERRNDSEEGGRAETSATPTGESTTESPNGGDVKVTGAEEIDWEPEEKTFDGYDQLEAIWNDPNISLETKSKLAMILTGGMPELPTVMSWRKVENSDGSVTVETLGTDGVVISRHRVVGDRNVARIERKIAREVELNSLMFGEQYRNRVADAALFEKAVEAVAPGADPEIVRGYYEKSKNGEKQPKNYEEIIEKVDRWLEENPGAVEAMRPEALRQRIKEATGKDPYEVARKQRGRSLEDQEALDEYVDALYPEGTREKMDGEARERAREERKQAWVDQMMAEAFDIGEEAFRRLTGRNGEPSGEERRKEKEERRNEGSALEGDSSAARGRAETSATPGETATPETAARDIEGIMREYDAAREGVETEFGMEAEEVLNQLAEDPWSVISDPYLGEGQKMAAIRYMNAYSAVEGIQEGSMAVARERAEEARAEIEKRTNRETGRIEKVTAADGRELYVVKGQVNGNESGVDFEHSDQTIVVLDPATGEYEMMSAERVISVFESIDAEEEYQRAMQAIEEQRISEIEEIAAGAEEERRKEKEERRKDSEAEGLEERTQGSETGTPEDKPATQTEESDADASRGLAEKAATPTETAPEDYLGETGRTGRTEEAQGGTPGDRPATQMEGDAEASRGLAEKAATPAGESPAEGPAERTSATPEGEAETAEVDYEKGEPEKVWESMMEEAEGDEEIVRETISDIIKDSIESLKAAEGALKKAREAKPEKRGKNAPEPTVKERMAAKKAAKAAVADAEKAVEEARARVEHWRRVAEQKNKGLQETITENLPKAGAPAEIPAKEDLTEVPEFTRDDPQKARDRGYVRNGGGIVERNTEDKIVAEGAEIEVKFGENETVKGHVALVEAEDLQPSHILGARNPKHFIPEAQPKDRSDTVSENAAHKIASNIRPEEITGSVTAYMGAPSVNRRVEAIQGNSRSDALKVMWDDYKDQGEKYRQYLLDNAERLGLDPEVIKQMKNPVLVNLLDVDDQEAIRLGQFTATDTESGGMERMRPDHTAKKMGDRVESFLNILLEGDEEASLEQLIDENGVAVLKWMADRNRGYITDTQYTSAFDTKGRMTAEAKNDIKQIMFSAIFGGGDKAFSEAFTRLPAKAQKAILKTAFRDYKSPEDERLLPDLKAAVFAFEAMLDNADFVKAGNIKDALEAAEMWRNSYIFDSITGESYLPSERYTDFQIKLAAMLRGNTQKTLQDTFKRIYDLVQGRDEIGMADMFGDEEGPQQMSLNDAVREVTGFERDTKRPKPKIEQDNEQDREDIQSGTGTAGGRGERGDTGDSGRDEGAGREESSGRGREIEEGPTEGEAPEDKQTETTLTEQTEGSAAPAARGLAEKAATPEISEAGTEVKPTGTQDDSGRVRFQFAKSKEKFNQNRERAISENGLVMPGLADKEVEIVRVPRHEFDGTGEEAKKAAQEWAKENLKGVYTLTDSDGKEVEYSITMKAIKKYTNSTTTKKSANLGVHLAVLTRLPEVIGKSIEVEVHPDWPKGEGGERDETLVPGEELLIHRFYGAVEIEGKIYRVKTTIAETLSSLNIAHSYEVTKIELLEQEPSNSLKPTAPMQTSARSRNAKLSNNSDIRKLSGKKLLYGVEKSYDKGKKLLDESASSLDSHRKTEAKEEIATLLTEIARATGVPVEIVNDTTAATPTGKPLEEGRSVAGYTKDGKIYLNEDSMKPDTPLHEYTHLWNDMVRRENPKLWDRGKELLKETPEWKEVAEDPAYAHIHGNEDAIADEVSSRFTGKRGQERMEEMIREAKKRGPIAEAKAVSLVGRIKRWLKDMFKGLKKTLGKWTNRELKDLTLEEFSDMTLRDFVEGMNPKHGDKNLVGLHNISEAKLKKAIKNGGLANPSAAVINIERQTHEGYGAITLVMPSSLISKRTGRNAGTWVGDAWTPTYPKIEKDYSNKEGHQLFLKDIKRLPEEIKSLARTGWSTYLQEGNSAYLAPWYLSEKNMEIPERIHYSIDEIRKAGLERDFNEWIEEKERQYGIEEKLFVGYTPSGTPKYVPNTVENASRLMRKKGKNGASSWGATFPGFVARVEKGIGKLSEMRDEKSRLTSDHSKLEEFDKQWRDVYIDLAQKCMSEADGILGDSGYYRLAEVATKRNPAEYLRTQYGVNLTPNDEARLIAMREAIKRERPTMYMETKFERPVRIEEFEAAVVPEGINPEIERSLKAAGLKVVKYNPEIKDDRRRATLEACDSNDVRFQISQNREETEAMEPGAGYGRKGRSVTGNLFDWRVQPGQQSLLDLMESEAGGLEERRKKKEERRKDSEEGSLEERGKEKEERRKDSEMTEEEKEMLAAGERGDLAIDEFAERYADYRENLLRTEEERERLKDEIADIREAAKEEGRELTEAEMLRIEEAEERIAELDRQETQDDEEMGAARERLEGTLLEFYSLNNTPEDARDISREMARRAMAEVEMRQGGVWARRSGERPEERRKEKGERRNVSDAGASRGRAETSATPAGESTTESPEGESTTPTERMPATPEGEGATPTKGATSGDVFERAKKRAETAAADYRKSREISEGEAKSADGPIRYEGLGHLPDGERGEFAHAERVFTLSGGFGFTGSETVRDRGDVAFIFRALESKAVESVYAVFVKDGRPHIVHVSLGGPSMSIIDYTKIRAGFEAFGADKVYLVHNHPSGNLRPSPQDESFMRVAAGMFEGTEVEGIIIDTTSGRYTVFDGLGTTEQYDRPREVEGEREIDVYSFEDVDRSIGEGLPEATRITGSKGIADFLAERRLNPGKKLSYLVLDRENKIIGNFHTEEESYESKQLAAEMVSTAVKYNGTSVIAYGGAEISLSGSRALQENIKKAGGQSIRLLDALQVESAGYRSAADDAYLAEPEESYGSEVVRDSGAMPESLKDVVDAMRDGVLEARKADATEKIEAMRAIGGNLSKLRQAMSRQRKYDTATVKSVTDLAKLLMEKGVLDGLGRGDMKRILASAGNVVGKQPEGVKKEVDKIMDIMIGNQMRAAAEQFRNMLHTKAVKTKKVNSDGAEIDVMGDLDPQGQTVLDVTKKTYQMSREEIGRRLDEAQDRMGSSSQPIAENAALEYEGLLLAKAYADKITDSKEEEEALKDELRQAKEEKQAGRLTREQYQQYEDAIADALRDNKIERTEAYNELSEALGGRLSESAEKAQEWRDAEKARVAEIQHNANSDMQGRNADPHHTIKGIATWVNNDLVQFFLRPLATFDQMLRLFGNKNVRGEGYLWNRFMRQWVHSAENEYNGYREALETLDNKVREIFRSGGNFRSHRIVQGVTAGAKRFRPKKMSDLFFIDKLLPKMAVEMQSEGETVEYELTQCELLYIYMVNKMADGRMKLRKMGITEETVDKIANFIDPRLIEFADWVQSEFLTDMRNKYNEVYKRMFGASMAAIEDYFPLKILSGARTQTVEIGKDDEGEGLPGTTAGSIIKRRRNSLALDVTNSNAINVLLNHLQEMEHWAAYAEFDRDLGTLLSYRRFRNQVENMSSVYGSGKKLWEEFKKVCHVAAGSYNPKATTLDKTAVNLAKGVTASKVSLRMYTALKQFLSFPAYFSDASPEYLAEAIVNPYKAWTWGMENLPLFHKRWHSRMAGDPRLLKTEMDWKMWKGKVMEISSRVGMSPNAFVDALTVSMGSYAMYKTRLRKYKRRGYSQEAAERKAKEDATILYNQTQQSSESAFLSTMQVDRSWLSVLLTVFRNSSMSYTRQLYDAVRNIGRRAKPGYRAKSIEFMTKQMERDGVETEKARKEATREYDRGALRDLVKVGIFGYALQYLWNLGAYLPYLILGNDDEEKEKMKDDAMIHAMFGSIEGLTAGDVQSAMWNQIANGDMSLRGVSKDMPAVSDLEAIYEKFADEKNGDKIAAINDLINLFVSVGVGANPQSLTDAVIAVMEYCGDDAQMRNECAIMIARIINCPPSQLDKIYFDEIEMTGDEAYKLTAAQLAERFANYKIKRNAPFVHKLYPKELREKRQAKYEKKVMDPAMEAFEERTTLAAGGTTLKEILEDAKELEKERRDIGKLKSEDEEEWKRRVEEIESRPGWKRAKEVRKYKERIKELSKRWRNARTPAERNAAAREMIEAKRELFEGVSY